ncbi:MAG: ABC transporter ATP-binding protein [Planctomycetota bacterium]|jgi:ABC-2 type transport system ATP-binding protein
MPDPAVEIRDLTKTFGRVHAVDGLVMDVPAGEIFGLLGPNGAGKTTTLRILSALLRPTAGSVRVFGLDAWRQHPQLATRCGMMIEEPGLFPNLSGRKNLEILARLRGLKGPTLRDEVDRALDFAGLQDAAERPVRTYSTGMKQMVGLALAMIGSPDLIVLDEPTSGLDPASVVHLRETLLDLHRTRGATFLLSSHHLAEMESLCTRVAILGHGRLLAAGAPDDLFTDDPATVRLKVSDKTRAEGIASALEECRLLEGTGKDLEVEIRPSVVPRLIRHLLEADIEVAEVRPVRSRLEEAYLRLTAKAREAGAREP